MLEKMIEKKLMDFSTVPVKVVDNTLGIIEGTIVPVVITGKVDGDKIDPEKVFIFPSSFEKISKELSLSVKKVIDLEMERLNMILADKVNREFIGIPAI